MLGSLAEVLPRAAERFGDRRALVVGDESFSFTELDALSSALAASLVGLGVAPGRSRHALRAEFVGVDRQLLRRAEDGRRHQPGQRHADAGRGGLRDRGLRREGVDRQPGEDPGPRSRRVSSGLESIVFGDEPVAGATPFGELIAGSEGFDPVPVAPDALSTIGYTSGTTGRPKGAMQSPSRGPAQRRHDRADAPQVGARHGRLRAALSARLRQRRLQRRAHVRADAGAASAFRRGRDALEHRDPPRHDVRGRADDVHVHARPSRPRAPSTCRSLTRCTVGGQTMPVAKMEEVERRFGCPLIELWGMTELAGLGTTFPSNGPHKLGSIGVALPVRRGPHRRRR